MSSKQYYMYLLTSCPVYCSSDILRGHDHLSDWTAVIDIAPENLTFTLNHDLTVTRPWYTAYEQRCLPPARHNFFSSRESRVQSISQIHIQDPHLQTADLLFRDNPHFQSLQSLQSLSINLSTPVSDQT